MLWRIGPEGSFGLQPRILEGFDLTLACRVWSGELIVDCMQECASSAPAEVHDCKVLLLAAVCHAILMNVYRFSNKLVVKLMFRLHLWWPNVSLWRTWLGCEHTNLVLPASGMYGHNWCPIRVSNNEAHIMSRQLRKVLPRIIVEILKSSGFLLESAVVYGQSFWSKVGWLHVSLSTRLPRP